MRAYYKQMNILQHKMVFITAGHKMLMTTMQPMNKSAIIYYPLVYM